MNFIKRKVRDAIQFIIDKVHGKPIDIVSTVAYTVVVYYLVIVVNIIYKTATSEFPIIPRVIPSFGYAALIALPLTIYFLSLAGDFYKKPSRRIQLIVFSIICTTVFASGYILQIANLGFLGWLNNIKNIHVIPATLLSGNIRLISFLFPLVAVIPISTLVVQMLADRDIRKKVREYELDVLLPTVHQIDDTTIDIKICEDIETGDDCIVPEKKTYEHALISGSSGSGKTATYVKPVIEQLFYKKAYIREKLKALAYESLKEGIAVLTQPVSNYWFNNNFSMELIRPKEGKEPEYKEKFKKFIVGVRDKNELVYNDTINKGIIELDKLEGDSKYRIKISLKNKGMVIKEITHEVTKDMNNSAIKLGDGYEDITMCLYELNAQVEDVHIDNILKQEAVIKETEEKLRINFPELKDSYTYDIKINMLGSGKIIYKNVGMCVVAPDGGLPSDTIKLAEEHGINVHKIDPTMEEIRKGGIAKFNPLKGGRPDKVGDIISSILVSMDHSRGFDRTNPYFTNASVRAVRNLVILLKEMYPVMYGGKDPTLRDVLDCLNDFNSVIPMVEAMKKDVAKRAKWGSVISYFVANFYPPPTDDRGRPITGVVQGSQRRKTEEAISGVINQLDNFVTREEVAYILCDRENSLDLAKIIENGECIAIATRQNELGERLGKAFALFFILSIQNAVLSRYSEDENPEIPFHLIIDEFPFYINDNTKVFFTFARKYHCAVTVAIQNMAQLREISEVYKETIFANTDTKVLLPNSNVEDREYWSKYFGTYETFEMQTGVHMSSIFADNPKYSEMRRGKLQSKRIVTEQEIDELTFKEALYSYTDKKGRRRKGKGITDFVTIQKTPKTRFFDFEKYNPVGDPADMELLPVDDNNQKCNEEKSDITTITNEELMQLLPIDDSVTINKDQAIDSVPEDEADREAVKAVKSEINTKESIAFEIASEAIDLSRIDIQDIGELEYEDIEGVNSNQERQANDSIDSEVVSKRAEKESEEEPEAEAVEQPIDLADIDITQIDFTLEGEHNE